MSIKSIKSITPNPPANFTPEMGNYKALSPFRYWCQKVLPLVYDDSLSYYELLCKVIDYLNKTMEDVDTLHGDITNLNEAYMKLQNYVNNYFSSLDVQEEINNKIDELVNSGKLDILLNKFTPFTTPEMYGAKGDGISDDTEPLQMALNNRGLVILSKRYKISKTLNLYGGTTVKQAGNSIIINTSADYVFKTTSEKYTSIGSTIDDVKIDCNGKGGLFIDNSIPNLEIRKITICNVGTNGIYIINNISNKIIGGDIFITGCKLNYIDGNITWGEYDLTRENVGIRCENFYDSFIKTIYCLGLQIGIIAKNSQQINVGSYHYWIGTDGTDENTYRYNDWKNTRAIKLESAYWTFDLFYPDKPHIAVHGGSVIANKTHFIICPKTAVSEYTSDNDTNCYLSYMSEPYQTHRFKGADIKIDDERFYFKAYYNNNSLIPFRRGTFEIEWAYPQKIVNEPTVGVNLNTSDINYPIRISKDKWIPIGYVLCTTGNLNINIASNDNSISCDINILTKRYICRVKSATMFKGEQENTLELGLGNVINSEFKDTVWQPILLKSSVDSYIYVSARGISTFTPNQWSGTYDGEPEKKYNFELLT